MWNKGRPPQIFLGEALSKLNQKETKNSGEVFPNLSRELGTHVQCLGVKLELVRDKVEAEVPAAADVLLQVEGLLPGGALAGVEEPVGLLPVDEVTHRELLAPSHLNPRGIGSFSGRRRAQGLPIEEK